MKVGSDWLQHFPEVLFALGWWLARRRRPTRSASFCLGPCYQLPLLPACSWRWPYNVCSWPLASGRSLLQTPGHWEGNFPMRPVALPCETYGNLARGCDVVMAEEVRNWDASWFRNIGTTTIKETLEGECWKYGWALLLFFSSMACGNPKVLYLPAPLRPFRKSLKCELET